MLSYCRCSIWKNVCIDIIHTIHTSRISQFPTTSPLLDHPFMLPLDWCQDGCNGSCRLPKRPGDSTALVTSDILVLMALAASEIDSFDSLKWPKGNAKWPKWPQRSWSKMMLTHEEWNFEDLKEVLRFAAVVMVFDGFNRIFLGDEIGCADV